jgi:hypothetical protein
MSRVAHIKPEADEGSDLHKATRKVVKALERASSADDISKLGNTLAKLMIAQQKLDEASFGDAFADPDPVPPPKP